MDDVSILWLMWAVPVFICCYPCLILADKRKPRKHAHGPAPKLPRVRRPIWRRALTANAASLKAQQGGSSLCCLPWELKEVIFEHVFSNQGAVLFEWSRRASSLNRNHLLALPLTCRRLYGEMLRFVISSQIFQAHSISGLGRFLSITPKHHLCWITNLKVPVSQTEHPLSSKHAWKAWTRLWGYLVYELRGIQHVTVLLRRGEPWPLHHEQERFDPIRALRMESAVAVAAWISPMFDLPMPVTLEMNISTGSHSHRIESSRKPVTDKMRQADDELAAWQVFSGAEVREVRKVQEITGQLDGLKLQAGIVVCEEMKVKLEAANRWQDELYLAHVMAGAASAPSTEE